MSAREPPPELRLGNVRYVLSHEPASEHARRPGRPGPVYRSVPGGSVAVPSGRVFVRFASGERALDHAAALARLGYTIAEAPEWSPESAWVAAADASVETALSGIPALSRLPGVEHAEPELLRERVPRAPG
jgi:hypothetical protein